MDPVTTVTLLDFAFFFPTNTSNRTCQRQQQKIRTDAERSLLLLVVINTIIVPPRNASFWTTFFQIPPVFFSCTVTEVQRQFHMQAFGPFFWGHY